MASKSLFELRWVCRFESQNLTKILIFYRKFRILLSFIKWSTWIDYATKQFIMRLQIIQFRKHDTALFIYSLNSQGKHALSACRHNSLDAITRIQFIGIAYKRRVLLRIQFSAMSFPLWSSNIMTWSSSKPNVLCEILEISC